MSRVISRKDRQTDQLQECDMPHSQSVRLCLFDSEFSMSAEALEKVAVEVYQIRKLTGKCSTRRQFEL